MNLSATYYVDAQTGAVIDVRAESAEALTMMPSSYRSTGTGLLAPTRVGAAEGDAVPVTGTSRAMGDVSAIGMEQGGGIVLIDPTTPTYDPATGQGGIETFDMSGLSQGDAPGNLVTSDSPHLPER